MIHTDVCDRIGIEYPIFQGGMAWVSEHRLAAAVSNAGGLGIISAMNAPGEYLREEIRACRELGVETDASACARDYEHNLSIGHFFLPGAEEALEALQRKYRLFLVSNGTAAVQKGRMTSANLYRFFEQVFVSEEIGYNKPSKEYFDACFARIPDFDREKAVIVGDSLTSDILGGKNAGITTVWVNPEHLPWGNIQPDYEIEALRQLEPLLEVL